MPRSKLKVDPNIATKRQINTQNSPLLKLPAELCTKIYTLTFTTSDALEITFNNINTQTHLLRVCHQIRQEARPIFYSASSFLIVNIHEAYTHRFLEDACRSMARRVRHLEIRLAVPATWPAAFRALNRHPPGSDIRRDELRPFVITVWELGRTLRSYGVRIDNSLMRQRQSIMNRWIMQAVSNFPSIL